MGARSTKITVVQEGGADSQPTDAALLKALHAEYCNSKTRASGKVAWDLQNNEYHSTNERNITEVLLVDHDGLHVLDLPSSAGGQSPAAGQSDKSTRTDSSLKPLQPPPSTGDKFPGAHEAVATAAVSAASAIGRQQSAQVGTSNRQNGASAVALPMLFTQPKSPASPKSPTASKPKRPPTGSPMHASRTTGKPTTGKPPTATAVAATAVASNATQVATVCAPAMQQNGFRLSPVSAPPANAVDATTGPAVPNAAAAAAVGPSEVAVTGTPVQWVIRPGPPIETAYRLGKVLGQGSFGVVRAATHIASEAEVAVKTIRKSMLRATDVTALRREVEILHHLSGHPTISQLLGVYEEPCQLHLVLELYTGGDLFDAIIGNGRHSERTAAEVLRTMMKALSYCHSMGVAHRDIKPENFMLTAELPKEFQNKQMQQPQPQVTGGRQIPLAPPLVGIGERLKLIDFGLSVFCTDDAPLTDIVGTSYYVAPEVLEGRYSLPADVWSAGVILHIMLTGYAPFDGKDDREILRAVRKGNLDLVKDPIWRSISPQAMAVLTAVLNRDPKKRATADQVLAMPWLGQSSDTCTAPSTPLPGMVSERLQHFARMSSFQKEARRVVAGLMRPEEVAGLVALFRGLDRDHDGRISLAELKEGIARQSLLRGGPIGSQSPPFSEEQLRELLRRSDLNGDGLLDESEFLGAALPVSALARQASVVTPTSTSHQLGSSNICLSTQGVGQSGSALSAAFKHFDTDGSGFITADEMRVALAQHRHPSGKRLDVQALISRHDRDADGRISYLEFVDMLVQDMDDNDDIDDLCDTTAVHSSRQQQPSQQQISQPTSEIITSSARRGSVGGDGAERMFRSSENVSAWGCSGVESSAAAAVKDSVSGSGSKSQRDGGASRAFSQSSTVAAQRPSSRMSTLEWSDEVADSEDDVAAAAATAAATASATVRISGGGTAAPRVPSRLSQPQMQMHQQQQTGSTPAPRVAIGTDSCSGNHRVSVGGYINATCGDTADAGSSGLPQLAEIPDPFHGDVVHYGIGDTSTTVALLSPTQQQRSGIRAVAPPRLQLPYQPAVDIRSWRLSLGGVVPDEHVVVAGGGGAVASPPYMVGPRPSAPSGSRRHRVGTPLDPPNDQSLGHTFSPVSDAQIAGKATAATAIGGAVASSLPCSPSAVAAALVAHRISAARGSAGAASTSAVAQHRPQPLLPLQLSVGAQLQMQQQTQLGSPGGDKLADRTAAVVLTSTLPLPPPGTWPLVPSSGGSSGATVRPSRVSATGMMPVRNLVPWPAPPLSSGGGAPVIASPTSAEGLRPAPPSAPLPVLHSIAAAAATGTSTGKRSRNRRQSTGSPAWPLLNVSGVASPSTASNIPHPPQQQLQQHPSPHGHPHQHHSLYQSKQPSCYNHSISCSGAGSCNSGSNNTLSPRVMLGVTAAAAPGLVEWANATPQAGRRSRRTTQAGFSTSGTEDLILTARPSSDFDVVAYGCGGGRTAGIIYGNGEDDASLSHVLPPGVTGLGFRAPYRPLTSSTSGRLL